MPDLITVRKVHKRYGRKPVLRGVELSVGAGEVVALLGANGAGKTTLLRAIGGLSRPDRGDIELGGASFNTGGHELRRYIGLVSHASLLYDNLSAPENLNFFARLYDMQSPAARIEWTLRSVDLWHRRRDLVRTYSRGMVQRLSIARAILHDPPVLLLDEPDTGLDQESAEMLHALIRKLGVGERAILLTTHNLERALAWADRICLLGDGRIVYSEETANLTGDELRRRYQEASQAA